MTSTLIVYSQKLTDVEYIYRRVNKPTGRTVCLTNFLLFLIIQKKIYFLESKILSKFAIFRP